MTETIKYRLSGKQDLNNIKDLLMRAELPVADIDEAGIDFIVAVNDKNDLIGCIGLEHHERDGLLRSFAVEQSYRNKKIGHELLDRFLSMSRQYSVSNLHLLTTTAEKFFTNAGFSVLSRDEAPVSIKATTEFSSICPSSSTYMMMKDIQKKEACLRKDTQVFQKDKESGSAYWAINGEGLMLTYFEVPPATSFATHKHESEQITYILEGELCFEIENKTYRLVSGDTIMIPSNKPHRVWTDKQPAKAIDAWSPVNEKYTLPGRAEKVKQIN